MSTNKKNKGKVGRPKDPDGPKKSVFAKIAQATLDELEEIRNSMAPVPSQSSLINQAVIEYVDRHRKNDQGTKQPID